MTAARRTGWTTPAVCLALFGGLAVLSTVALVPLSVLTHQNFDGVVALVIGIPAAVVGAIAARRVPRNPVAWLLLAIGICLILATDGSDYALLTYRLGHHLPLRLLALGLNQLWGPTIELLGLVILLFPDGRLASRPWRWALGAYCTIFGLELIALTVATAQAVSGPVVHVDATGGLPATDYPHGWYALADHAGMLALLAFIVAFIARQALSWRRSTGERRQQLKWLASGAAVSIVGLVLAVIFATSSSSVATVGQWIGTIAWFGLAALPASIGVAILRYRLYDIDRIISRTLAYALVTALLVGVFAGLVLLTTDVLSLSSPVAVAASTLAAAALFNPLRQRVQRVVDRRFNRTRYNADRTVAAFAAGLKDATDVTAVRDDLTTVVQQTLEPAHVSLWISPHP